MKKNSISNLILALGIWCLPVLSGCTREVPEFVDVQSVTEDTPLQENMTQQDVSGADIVVTEPEEVLPVVVHVCGAVVSPGVYKLPAGSRIVDAVDMAGGLSENADKSYVNLASVPTDGDQIFIPTMEEAVVMKQAQESGAFIGKVNINTADKALLCSLPGIGDTRAADIIAYRQKHGSFSTIEDIMQVSGIKESSFQKIKELIVVN